MQSVLIYGSMFTLSVCLANRAKKTNNQLYITGIVFLLSAVCGCRALSVGNDTKSYYNICLAILNSSPIGYATLEKGFEYLCHLLLAIIPSPHFVFAVIAVLTYALVMSRLWELRNIAEFDWSVAGFILSFFPFTLSGIRQGLALAIVFWATRYLSNKKYATYILFVLIASTLHNTAIIACANLLWEIRLWRHLKKEIASYSLQFLLQLLLLQHF
jgi:transmembrane protein EpsG